MKKILTQKEKDEIEYEGIMRLVEAIILQVLDYVSISGKWYPRELGLDTLLKKKQLLREMYYWLKDDKWDIWLGIYCNYKSYSKTNIKKNFEKIRKQSVKYCNARIKSAKQNTNTTGKSTSPAQDR